MVYLHQSDTKAFGHFFESQKCRKNKEGNPQCSPVQKDKHWHALYVCCYACQSKTTSRQKACLDSASILSFMLIKMWLSLVPPTLALCGMNQLKTWSVLYISRWQVGKEIQATRKDSLDETRG